MNVPENRPDWDQEKADEIHGSLVLVGVTREAPDGDRTEQFYGTVIACDPRSGIELRLGGTRHGETYTLPPDTSSFEPAEPGEYRLRSTGEVVKDPDYTTVWVVAPPTN